MGTFVTSALQILHNHTETGNIAILSAEMASAWHMAESPKSDPAKCVEEQ